MKSNDEKKAKRKWGTHGLVANVRETPVNQSTEHFNSYMEKVKVNSHPPKERDRLFFRDENPSRALLLREVFGIWT